MAGNPLVVAIFLLAEVCASAGPALLTLCIHDDGTMRYEPTMALCCKLNDQGQGECCSHEEGKPFEGGALTPEDSCQDFGVVISQVSISAASIKQILTPGTEICDVLPVVARTPGVPLFERSIAAGGCGPPGDHTLLDLSTVVLRI